MKVVTDKDGLRFIFFPFSYSYDRDQFMQLEDTLKGAIGIDAYLRHIGIYAYQCRLY